MIDLRSDTVTQPTQAMREAMYRATVGDDVYGDDPTVKALEELAATMLGKEAALFVPSGTMGNQLAIMTHTSRGQEIILGTQSHIMMHERGGAAALSGVMTRSLDYTNALPDVDKIRSAIRGQDLHFPETGLICMENALATGKVVPLEIMQQVYALAQEHKVPVHIDGARVFNAATALGVDVTQITACCDSVQSCLSKGLCAPVGSILAGTKEFIGEALKNRKMLGGGLRQAGFLAAAGIEALTVMSKRLGEDHDNAKYMASQLKKMEEIQIDESQVEINMVFFRVLRKDSFTNALPEQMKKLGVLISETEDELFRFVTSNDVSRDNIDTAILALKQCLSA